LGVVNFPGNLEHCFVGRFEKEFELEEVSDFFLIWSDGDDNETEFLGSYECRFVGVPYQRAFRNARVGWIEMWNEAFGHQLCMQRFGEGRNNSFGVFYGERGHFFCCTL